MIRQVRNQHRRGFTLIEILVVVGIILFLMSISLVALRNSISIARQKQTEATILKIHGLMQQRYDAFYRAMERTNLQQAKDKMRRDWYSVKQMIPPDKAIDVMVKKTIVQTRFPQTFAEKNLFLTPPPGVTTVPVNHKMETESAALLYWILTSSEIFGVAPVDESEFSSSEIRDTDGDGLMEFVDGWGRPLRFYRWPDHLFRPGDGSSTPPGLYMSGGTMSLALPDRTYVNQIWSGLPAMPTAAGEMDPLARDPDDPTGQLWRFVSSQGTAIAATTVQNLYGTPSTYNAFLVISAGPDGVLGLLEPSNEVVANLAASPPTFTGVSDTAPALGTPQGQLGALAPISYTGSGDTPLNDNVSNRRR